MQWGPGGTAGPHDGSPTASGVCGRTPGEAAHPVGPNFSKGTYSNGRPVRDSLRVLRSVTSVTISSSS